MWHPILLPKQLHILAWAATIGYGRDRTVCMNRHCFEASRSGHPLGVQSKMDRFTVKRVSSWAMRLHGFNLT